MCKSKYICDFFLTVGDQLLPLNSRGLFIIFTPNKPDKYGIKFWGLLISNQILLQILLSLEAQEKEQSGGVTLRESVVTKHIKKEHIKSKGCTFFCDNF